MSVRIKVMRDLRECCTGIDERWTLARFLSYNSQMLYDIIKDARSVYEC